MKYYKLFFIVCSLLVAQEMYSQRISIPLNQSDDRFTLRAERHYSLGNEEYYFYVRNNTNDEYKIVVNVTINSTCHNPSNFALDVNGIVTLKPGGEFTPKTDYVHIFTGGAAKEKCRKKDGDSYTYFSSITYSYTSITNVSEEKLKKEKEEKLKEEERLAERKKKEEQKSSLNKSSSDQSQKSNNTQDTSKNDFWSVKKKSNSSEKGQTNVVPDQAFHKNLPDLLRTTDGGYFQRGTDGQFREINAAEYAEAKRVRDTGSPKSQDNAPQISAEEIRASINKIAVDNQAFHDAVDQNIKKQNEFRQQNYYYAEAVRNGQKNLSELSKLNGNYNSVTDLEAEFNQKLHSIQSEVNNLEQARNSKLNNAVAANFGGSNSTEQAVGQGIAVIGSIINSATAEKEAKAAEEALRRQREEQLAAIEEAKKQALIGLRMKLLNSFPDGGTPLSSHKISEPEVFLFAYITDKATFDQEQSSVTVIDVFPVQKYSDGSYPYKTTLSNKLSGYAKGDITIVGYYTDKSKAIEMYKSFVNLAQKSKMKVQTVTYKASGTDSTKQKGKDFWGHDKENTEEKKEGKSDDFWKSKMP